MLAGVGREVFDVVIVVSFVLLAGVSRDLMGEGAARAAAYALVPMMGVFVVASVDSQDVLLFCFEDACGEPQLSWMERALCAIPFGAASGAFLVLLRRRELKLQVPRRSALPAMVVLMAGLSSLAAYRTTSRFTEDVSFRRSLQPQTPLPLGREEETQHLGVVLGLEFDWIAARWSVQRMTPVGDGFANFPNASRSSTPSMTAMGHSFMKFTRTTRSSYELTAMVGSYCSTSNAGEVRAPSA